MFKSLKSRIVVSIICVVLASLVITTLFFGQRAKHELSVAFEANALTLLAATKNHVESQYRSILYHKETVLSRRKIELQNNTTIAFSLVTSAFNQALRGDISETVAKKHVIEDLKGLRYDDGVGYFWINDTTRPYPRMIMHPTIPKLDGSILDDPIFNCALGKKENLFKAFVDVCFDKEEGYVDYLWPKPIPGGITNEQPKISYVKLFQPWHWVIGTGVYIDDIEKDVQQRIDAVIRDLNKTITKQKIGESGYFFIFDENNNMLVHPNLAGTDGASLINPETGKKLLDELKGVVFKTEPFMEYLWDKPGYQGDYRFPKKAYVTYYEPLGWYISSSFYKEDFAKKIELLMYQIWFFSIMLLLFTLLLSLLVARSVTEPLNTLVRAISKTDSNGIPSEAIKEAGTTEVQALGHTMNAMITAIRDSRKALQQSEAKFRGLIESSSDWIWETDKEGMYTYSSPQVANCLGYTPEEIIGKTPFVFMPKEEAERVEALFKESVAKGAPIVLCENVNLHKDGHRVVVETSGVPVLDELGQVVGYRGVDRDITERTEAKKILLHERNFNEKLFNSMAGISYLLSEDHRLVRWNQNFETITAYSAEELSAMSALDFFPHEAKAYVEEQTKKCFEEGRASFELPLVTKTGQQYNYLFRGERVLIGDAEFLVGQGIDISARKKMEDRLRVTLEEKETLLRELYHRTKNNMQVISGMLTLQAKASADDRIESFFREMIQRIEAMTLVHQKLYQSKDLSRINLKDYLVDLTEHIMRAYHINKETIRIVEDVADLDVVIDVAIPCGLIVNELLSNVFKYAFPDGQNGEVALEAHVLEEDIVELVVRDTGVGLGDDFDIEKCKSMGLRTVRMIAEHQLGGQVVLRTDDGVECTIVFPNVFYQERV